MNETKVRTKRIERYKDGHIKVYREKIQVDDSGNIISREDVPVIITKELENIQAMFNNYTSTHNLKGDTNA